MAISNTIPGFEGLTSSSSNLIKQLMSGQLGGAQKREIFNAGAERGVASGMPGSTGIAGSLFANNDLRSIGVASGENQQKGFQDLLAMITGFSGTVTPTTGQELQDQASRRSMTYQQQRDRDEKSAFEAAEQRKRFYAQKPSVSLDRGLIRAGGRGDSDISIPWWERS